MLQFAQENTMQGFKTEEYMDVLIRIVNREVIMGDMCGEMKFFAINSLTTLMDIFPQLCNSLVNLGYVKAIKFTMDLNLGMLDLNEACVKALDRIVLEHPAQVLKSGAIPSLLEQMDFYGVGTQ
jgi:hypothetical protein